MGVCQDFLYKKNVWYLEVHKGIEFSWRRSLLGGAQNTKDVPALCTSKKLVIVVIIYQSENIEL